MQRKVVSFFILYFCLVEATAQINFNCIIKNSFTGKAVAGATVILNNGKKEIAKEDGTVQFSDITKGSYKVTISNTGFNEQHLTIDIPQTNPLLEIVLVPNEEKLEEVIVSSSRTNSRIEDLPTKVEVLGNEEVGEENGIKPGNIASLLGDVAGIQIQQTSAATANADARVQGLPGKYTQILRDGLPLFGGYSGSFSILQIPPSDLKQIEIIKGASSTLYGGGAIAGMINLVSKTPKLNTQERAVTFNQSTFRESNLNAFLSSRSKKFGYTFFTGGTYQQQVDVNKDGLSDGPNLKALFLHPRLFFYPNEKQTLILGYNLTYEERKGGDMQVLQQKQDNLHQFFIANKSLRNTAEVELETKLNDKDKLTCKGSASFFNRDISTAIFGMKASQLSYFSEFSYLKKFTRHTIVGGFNFSGENFSKQSPDSSGIPDYSRQTIGLFAQDDWKISTKFTAQAGFRFDHHNEYGNFVLPRISFLYRLTNHFTSRIGGGFGYTIPTLFANDIDERDYKKITNTNNLSAEKSKGINWDINYKQTFDDWHLTVNQMFYITEIKNPVIKDSGSNGLIYFYTAGKPLNTKGFETYIAATKDELEIYLGYTYTVAKQLYSSTNPYVSLSAGNKFASVIAYEFSSSFRAGIEAAYTGSQYLDNGSTTPGYLFAAAMLRYNIKNISLVLNCENLFDYRQTKKETIFTGTISNPAFKQIWAPLDGRIINFSAKISW